MPDGGSILGLESDDDVKINASGSLIDPIMVCSGQQKDKASRWLKSGRPRPFYAPTGLNTLGVMAE